MSKTWRNILIIVAVIAVLGGALAFLLLSGDPAEDPDDSGNTGDTTETEAISLIDIKTETSTVSPIRTAEICSEAYGSFTVLQDENGSLTVKGFEDLALQPYALGNLASTLTNISATKKIAEAENLADFGLDKPQATFKVTYENGETYAFEFGNEEPYGSGHYFRFADSNTVYLVNTSVLEAIILDPNAYISTTLYSTPTLPTAADNETVTAVLRDFDLSGSFYGNEGLAMRMLGNNDKKEYTYTTYLITKPLVRPSSSDKLGEALLSSTSLSANIAVVPRYTQKDLKTYGLNDPYVVAKLHTAAQISATSEETDETVISYKNVEEHTVTLSKPDKDGMHYVIVDDNPSIFQISGESIEWLGLTYANSVSSLLFLKDIATVKDVTYTINGEVTRFQLTHYPDKEDTDEQLVVVSDGKTIDTQQFRCFYQVTMGLSRTGETEEKPSGTPEVRIQINGNDDYQLDVKLYNAGASVYLVQNGDDVYKITASQVRNFIKQMNNLLEGKEVNTNN